MQKLFTDNLVKGVKTDDLTLLNTVYHKPVKSPIDGKWSKPQIDLVYKNQTTGRKGVQCIIDPDYEFFELNEDIPYKNHAYDFAKIENVHPVRCKHSDVIKTIAQLVGKEDLFWMNKNNGNYSGNKNFFLEPTIFNADMNISDHYRYRFNKRYTNRIDTPTKMYFDIECDTINMRKDFPELGECPVNTISCIKDGTIYSFITRDKTNPSMVHFEREVFSNPGMVEAEFVQFIKDYVGGDDPDIYQGRLEALNMTELEIKFLFFDTEMETIQAFFDCVNTLQPDFVLAWNMAFDIPTLFERIRVNGFNPADIVCHKDFKNAICDYFVDSEHMNEYEERGDYSNISCYSAYVCQMIQFASRRKGQSAIENYKIDYIGELICGVKKLDYSHICTHIKDFPRANFKMFVLYNIIDTVVQKCIEERVQDVDYLYTNALMFNTRYSKTHRQTIYLSNKRTQSYWDMGYVKGNNANIHETKQAFPGAFVADLNLISNYAREFINKMPLRLFKNLNDFDYTALYPSLYREWNMCKNGLIAQLIFPEAQKYENRLNVEAYNRSNAFAQDYHSRNYIDFGHRWFNLPSYSEMYQGIIDYYSKYIPTGSLYYFNKEYDNTVYVFPERKEKKTVKIPSRTAIEYAREHSPHVIKPYKKFNGDMSTVFDFCSDYIYQNRPDVVLKKQEVGVDKL